MGAVLRYDIKRGSGDFVAKLQDGKFAENNLFNTLKFYTGHNLYKESFSGSVNMEIENKFLKGKYEIVSKNSSIDSKKTLYNLTSERIESIATLKAGEYPLFVEIEGDTHSPNVAFDIKKTLNSKTGELLKKEVTNFLQNLFQ